MKTAKLVTMGLALSLALTTGLGIASANGTMTPVAALSNYSHWKEGARITVRQGVKWAVYNPYKVASKAVKFVANNPRFSLGFALGTATGVAASNAEVRDAIRELATATWNTLGQPVVDYAKANPDQLIAGGVGAAAAGNLAFIKVGKNSSNRAWEHKAVVGSLLGGFDKDQKWEKVNP